MESKFFPKLTVVSLTWLEGDKEGREKRVKKGCFVKRDRARVLFSCSGKAKKRCCVKSLWSQPNHWEEEMYHYTVGLFRFQEKGKKKVPINSCGSCLFFFFRRLHSTYVHMYTKHTHTSKETNIMQRLAFVFLCSCCRVWLLKKESILESRVECAIAVYRQKALLWFMARVPFRSFFFKKE